MEVFNSTPSGHISTTINGSVLASTANSTNATDTGGSQGSTVLQDALGYTTTVLVAIVMVGMGCATDVRIIMKHLKKPTGVVIGFVCQFGIMPAVAAFLAWVFAMPPGPTLGLLIVGSCPGGSTSNVAAHWLNGDMSLSVTMTTVSSVLALGMMPLLLFIYSNFFDLGELKVPYETIGIALATFIAPITIGVFIRYKWPKQAKKAITGFSIFGLFAITGTSIASVVTYTGLILLSTAQIACAAIFPGIGMTLGYALASLASLCKPLYLKQSERRTVGIETGVQNSQVGSAVILISSFPPEIIGQIILFPLIYLIGQLAWMILFAGLYRLYVRFYKKPNDSTESSLGDEKSNNFDTDTKSEDNSFPPSYDEVDFKTTEGHQNVSYEENEYNIVSEDEGKLGVDLKKKDYGKIRNSTSNETEITSL